MNGKVFWLLSVFLLSFFAVPTFAQCKNQQDKACWSLQYILYAAETDFLELRGSLSVKPGDRRVTPPNPDLSVGSIHVPCHPDFWLASGVAVYMCSAELPAQEAEEWYAKTMADLHELQYLWQYSEPPGADHYVDAGPQGCEVAHVETGHYGPYHADEPYIGEGPYLGQCPLHLQTVRQDRGTVRISFWLNSSENLARNPAESKSLELSASAKPPETVQPRSATATATATASLPAPAASPTAAPAAVIPAETPIPTPTSATPTSATPAPATPSATENLPAEPAVESAEAAAAKKFTDCDDLCQGLKWVLENRASSFRQFGARSGGSVASNTTSPGELVKLSGAASCVIHAEPLGSRKTSAWNESASSAIVAPVSTKGARRPSARTPARPAMQYVCYWPQESEAAAQSEFLNLVALLRLLIPSSWLTQQSVEADERSGARLTVWSAGDSRNKSAIGLYVSGKSVGLHISSGP